MAFYNCVIFDLDGTLIDSRGSIRSAFKACVSEFGLSEDAMAKALSMIGQPLKYILANMGIKDVTAAIETYRKTYFDTILDERAYEGIPELVQSISHDLCMVVCTNKGHTGAFMTLDNNELLDYFELVYTIDDGPAKPSSKAFETIHELLSKNGIEISNSGTLMVGDSPSDCDFASNSGMDYAHVMWGFFPDSALSCPHKYMLNDPFELFGILGLPMHLSDNVGQEFDLHNFEPRDIEKAVCDYLDVARKKNFLHVRIIHGKGKGVQRGIVRHLLAKREDVLDFKDAPPYLGGFGATLVSLKPSEVAE